MERFPLGPAPRLEEVKRRGLGRSGISVSEIGLGTMTFGSTVDEPTTRKTLDKAFDAGLTRARQKAVRLGKGFDKAGSAMTRSRTLPIAAAGAASGLFAALAFGCFYLGVARRYLALVR